MTHVLQFLGTLFLLTLFPITQLNAQCEYAVNEMDEFDSTRVIASIPVKIGYKIPTMVMADDGSYTVTDQGKAIFSFSENDSILSFFTTIAVLEREYIVTEKGFNILLKLSNDDVIGLYCVPDRGTFDRNTNLRIYQHTCIVPIDYYPALAMHYVEKIRINYPTKKRTLTLTPQQQEAFRNAARCIGEAVGHYPLGP